jgi:phosphopantothenoylcysteine decarboxylase/phosphopantothenate--cysteine ligase
VSGASALRDARGGARGAAGGEVFIGVAAVADYRPLTTAEHKLKKTSDT